MPNRTEIWDRERVVILKKLEDADITSCEAGFSGCCWTWALHPAHRHKRFWYYDKPESMLSDFKQVLLLCDHCHRIIEYNAELSERLFLALRGEEDYV